MGEEEEKKKRRVDPGQETSRPIRRSARQARAAARAAEMEAAAAVAAAADAEEAEAEAESEEAATPQQSGRKRRRANGGSGRYRSVARDLEDAAAEERVPPKPELPPSSSQGLDLEGLPVLDVFQVYSCLRSFSRQLFLSPFPLEAFVSALRCTDVNPLIDWVHFALLRAMKNRLEDLADEGEPSAIHCIRNLNWELLDLATWPIYLAEYLLTRGTELRYGMKLTDLKLLNSEYYMQPTIVKLKLLLSLCDDVLEVEAIRSELGSRMFDSDGNDEGGRRTGLRRKRRGYSVKSLANSSPPPEGSDDMDDDGNSDECYLCGMDGNLLCCDGCPAAFHSKCVGVVEDLLPEGDWFCPECVIQKNNVSRNMVKAARGAEVLGVDPHGRLYIGTCGYLLVVESSDVDSPCHYYHQIDFHSLFRVLMPCHPSYSSIANAISLFCGIVIETCNFNGRYKNSNKYSTSDAETDNRNLSPYKQRIEHEHFKKKRDGYCEQLDSPKACASNADQLNHDASHQNFTLRSVLTPENGNATTADERLNHPSQQNTVSANNDSHNCQQDAVCSYANGLPAEDKKDMPSQKKTSDCYIHSDLVSYTNYYSFGQIAASAGEELKHKLSENKEGKKLGHDAVSLQLKTVCKKYANISALTDQKLSVELLKEKCGWCNSCQISGGVDCIFRFVDGIFVEGFQSEQTKKSHLVLASHMILSIEERLNGLLIGPWENPQYSIYWRKEVLKASDVSSLKRPLLMLESNLRSVAFSVEWQKPADSVEVVGSAAHMLVRSSNKSSSYGSVIKPGRKPSNGELKVKSARKPGRPSNGEVKVESSRKRGRKPNVELRVESARKPGRKPSNGELKVDSRDVGVYWWRGGTLSRQVFHWKRLPQSLACKSARQAGYKKIPTIYYDGSEFARRFKYIAWRAAVEMVENVSQLILQIKELELNIKWTEILSNLPAAGATKETQKIAKLFKKVIIRRKRTEGTCGEYLLDFGKRENIPPVVAKHGIKFQEPSSERNRYWLSEGHVPLSLLKAYEAKALTRLLKKKDNPSMKMSEFKPRKPKISVFDYLLEKTKKQARGLCGHCNREVITCEAVNCQYCAALFHRKHFKVPKGAADAVYVCNKCLSEKVLGVNSPQKKTVSNKKSPKKKQSRKIVTRRKQIVVKFKKKTGKNKGKRGRPRKYPLIEAKNESPKLLAKKPANISKNEPVKRISKRLYDKYMKGNSNISEHSASCRKRKRTALKYPYWIDGLRWTQNLDDERSICFRKERVVFPSEDVEMSEVSPVCCLCQKCYIGEAIYISCENCEDWFHGDIYSITLENVNNLIGFKCHRCRLRGVRVCPHAETDIIHKVQPEREVIINRSIEDKDHNYPEALGTHDSLKELNDHIMEIEVGDHSCLKVLEEHNDMKELDSHSTEKELDIHNNMQKTDKELDGNLEVLVNQNIPEELDSTEGSKPTTTQAQCLHELDNPNSIKEHDTHSSPKELDNHQTQDELDDRNNLNELDCLSSLEVHDNHDCQKESDDYNCRKEIGCTEDIECSAAVTQTNGFLDEQFNIRISGNETLTIVSESESVKESIALQSENKSEENSVSGEHEIDLHVVVTL